MKVGRRPCFPALPAFGVWTRSFVSIHGGVHNNGGACEQQVLASGTFAISRKQNGLVSGATVLDNAFGSGSFLVAAALEKRRFIGIELNCDIRHFKRNRLDLISIAKLRLAEAKGILASHEGPTLLEHALQASGHPAIRKSEGLRCLTTPRRNHEGIHQLQ